MKLDRSQIFLAKSTRELIWKQYAVIGAIDEFYKQAFLFTRVRQFTPGFLLF